MAINYEYLQEKPLRSYCEAIFGKCGFNAVDSMIIVDVLLTADLFGIESHGVQRLIRYYNAIKEGSIQPEAETHIVYETPVSAVIDAPFTMGQLVARQSMQIAIEKAKEHSFGTVVVRGSNHFGIAGYYAEMAAKNDLLGICMTNTEAIAVPTHGRSAVLGTNPIAICMPSEPFNFLYDASTTVVTRGKLEVYNKNGEMLPHGWAADENGNQSTNASKTIQNIINKAGGGIFPLGGSTEETGSHKGYGLGVIVELFTSIFAAGTISPFVKKSGNADTSFCLMAIDYGIFGNKKDIKVRFCDLLRILRDSPAANGKRIYTHGEKEIESMTYKRINGIPVNLITMNELIKIGNEVGVPFSKSI